MKISCARPRGRGLYRAMRRTLLALVFAACGGVDSDPGGSSVGSFDEELPEFRETICESEARCSGLDKLACLQDVETDMADAKELLDAAGEARCAQCMHVKTIELQKILDASCDRAAGDEAAVLAACDLDPNDGAENYDEACAGKP